MIFATGATRFPGPILGNNLVSEVDDENRHKFCGSLAPDRRSDTTTIHEMLPRPGSAAWPMTPGGTVGGPVVGGGEHGGQGRQAVEGRGLLCV
jgi:hypothetical protein